MKDAVDILNERIAHIVKTTDAEIERLEAENSELKHKLSMCAGSWNSIEKIEEENKRLSKTIDNIVNQRYPEPDEKLVDYHVKSGKFEDGETIYFAACADYRNKVMKHIRKLWSHDAKKNSEVE